MLSLSLSSGDRPCRTPTTRLLFFFFFFSFLSPSSAASNISYPAHCNSIVPESNLTGVFIDLSAFSSFSFIKGHFFGGGKLKLFPLEATFISSSSSSSSSSASATFSLYSRNLQKTLTPGVLHANFKLVLDGEWSNRSHRSSNGNYSTLWTRREVFRLSGFWSASKGKLCAVGDNLQQGGQASSLSAVLKLDYPNVSDISTSLVRGIVESLDVSGSPNQFDSIWLLAYEQKHYKYSLISQAKRSCSHLNKEEESLGFEPNRTCYYLQKYLRGEIFTLDYSNGCGERTCGPMFEGLRFFMSLNMIKCSGDGKLHFVIQFANNSCLSDTSLFVPRSSLVGEGFWDHENNRISVLACRVLVEMSSRYSVSDCTIGFSLWFRRVFSLKNSRAIIGSIWSERNKSDTGYFEKVSFHSLGINMVMGTPALKYRYTKTDAVKKYCWKGNFTIPGKMRYPELSRQFHFLVSRGNVSWGSATLLSLGENYIGYDQDSNIYKIWKGSPPATLVSASIWNVSYRISYLLPANFSELNEQQEISAEGIYNAATGDLCMVGCRSLGRQLDAKQGAVADSDLIDCEILVNMQLTPQSQEGGEHVEGTIISMRSKSDSYYFDPLSVSLSTFIVRTEAAKSVRWMKIQTSIILVSLTFSCICIVVQLFQAKRKPKVFPLLSIVMFFILTLGHIIPLLMSYKSSMVWSASWLELNEVAVVVLMTITYLLQLWLLQAAWFTRSTAQSNALLLLMLCVLFLWVFICFGLLWAQVLQFQFRL